MSSESVIPLGTKLVYRQFPEVKYPMYSSAGNVCKIHIIWKDTGNKTESIFLPLYKTIMHEILTLENILQF